MPFSKEDLHMRKGLRESKNYSSRQFLQEFPEKHWTRSCSVLFSAILISRVGRIMNNIPPASPVFRQSYQFLHCQSSPFLYVAQPICSRSSSFPISRHCALHDDFLQAYSLSSHDVSEVTKFSFFYRLQETPLHSCLLQHPFIFSHFRPRYVHD